MKKIIYSKYSNERSVKFSIRTDILLDENGIKSVRKVPVSDEAKQHVESIYDKYRKLTELYKGQKIRVNKCRKSEEGLEFEFLTGRTFEEELDDFLAVKDYVGLVRKIKEYVEILEKSAAEGAFYKTQEFEKVFGSVELPDGLKAGTLNNIDLIFTNIILKDGWNVIDYEWTFEFPVPVHYIVYRAIHYYMTSTKREDITHLGLMQLFGITKEEEKAYDQMEYFFQQYILGEYIPVSLMYDKIAGNTVELEAMAQASMKDRLQIYLDCGNGFCEEASYFLTPMADEEGILKLSVDLNGQVRAIRIDPAADSCIVKIVRLSAVGEEHYTLNYCVNGIAFNSDTYLCRTTDPQIVIEGMKPGAKKVKAELVIRTLPADIAAVFEKYDTENETLKQTVDYQKQQLDAVFNSTSWKITAPLRRR